MAALQTRLQDPEYVNWVKASLCLSLAKGGLLTFADIKSKELLQDVRKNIFTRANIPVTGNGMCQNCNIKLVRNRWQASCNHGFCNGFLRAVIQAGIDPTFNFKLKKENLSNSNPLDWHNTPWELAKLFMNRGQTPLQTGPAQTDIIGIINFLAHCKICRMDIQNQQNIEKVRSARNQVMHSADLKLNNNDYNTLVQSMIDLLQDPKVLVGLQDAQTAVTRINEVNASTFIISLEDESQILKDLADEMKLMTGDLKIEINEVGTKQDVLEQQSRHDFEKLSNDFHLQLKNQEEELNKIVTTMVSLKHKILDDQGLQSQLVSQIIELHESVDDARNSFYTAHRQIIHRINTAEERIRATEEQTKVLKIKQDEMEKRVGEMNQPSVTEEDCQNLQQFLLDTYKSICDEVPLSPIYEGPNDDVLKVPVSDIYTDVTIVHHERNRTETERELKSYRDMFFYRGKKNKNIFVKGEAGVGKSVWCLRLLYAWYKTHSKACTLRKSMSEKIPTDNEKDIDDAMSQFGYLFFLPLRYVENKASIKDALFASVLERMTAKLYVFEHILEKRSNTVLFLIDGFDEFQGILNYRDLSDSTVVTTTRSWKFESYCSNIANPKIDSVVCLKGLNAQGVEKMIGNAIGALDDTGKDEAERIRQKDKCLGDIISAGLTESVKYPLILLIVVLTWLSNRSSLSLSLTKNMLNMLEVIFSRGDVKMSQNVSPENLNSENKIIYLRDYPTLVKYSTIIQNLGELAFEGLTSDNKSSSLVFRKDKLNMLCPANLDICFKLGLLTEITVFQSLLEKKTSYVSFYHKLIQELFAALWSVAKNVAAEEFRKLLTGVEDVMNYENVFLFVCGLRPTTGSSLSRHLVEKCNENNAVINYRTSHMSSDKYHECLENYCQTALKCVNEMNFSKNPGEDFYISDVRLYCHDEVGIEEVFRLIECNKMCLRSLYIFLSSAIAQRCVSHLLRLLNFTATLEVLNVEGDYQPDDETPKMISSVGHLNSNPNVTSEVFTLELCKNLHKINVEKIKVKSFTLSLENLSELKVWDVEMAECIKIENCPKLTKISIIDIRCNEFKLLELPMLETLRLYGISSSEVFIEKCQELNKLSAEQIECMSLRLWELQSLMKLTVKKSIIAKHISIGTCICRQLENVTIKNMAINDMQYIHLANQTDLPLVDFKLSQLLNLTLYSVKLLKLKNIQCRGFECEYEKLEKLELVSLQCYDLRIHEMESLVVLVLSNIETEEVISVHECANLEDITIENARCEGIALKEMEKVTRLTICNIDITESFNVQDCTSLTSISVEHVKCGTFKIIPGKYTKNLVLNDIDIGGSFMMQGCVELKRLLREAVVSSNEGECITRLSIDDINATEIQQLMIEHSREVFEFLMREHSREVFEFLMREHSREIFEFLLREHSHEIFEPLLGKRSRDTIKFLEHSLECITRPSKDNLIATRIRHLMIGHHEDFEFFMREHSAETLEILMGEHFHETFKFLMTELQRETFEFCRRTFKNCWFCCNLFIEHLKCGKRFLFTIN